MVDFILIVAREHVADEDEARWDEPLKKVGKSKPEPQV